MKLIIFLLATAISAGTHAQDKKLNIDSAIKTCASNVVSDECIVRHFKDTVEASVIRGRLVFENYCTLCHGREGKGDGRAARLHSPPPFNLTQSVAPREYIAQIIRKGGEAMNRGKGMPPWGEQLTDEQINDTLNFLWSIRVYK
jgi:cytochrome c553